MRMLEVALENKGTVFIAGSCDEAEKDVLVAFYLSSRTGTG